MTYRDGFSVSMMLNDTAMLQRLKGDCNFYNFLFTWKSIFLHILDCNGVFLS